MSIVIKVENISKKYIIGHQRKERYQTLRDALVNGVKNTFKTPFQWMKGENSKSITREEFWALNDVSFEINDGDRVGIVGRNGAGKSTLLKVLSRITEPTKGRIKIKGRVASLLEVGTGFHPELTGSENIYLNGAILGMSRAEVRRKFDEIVDFAEIERFLDTPVKRYSSGMYVRLAFAVAAYLEPEILIVDEVLAVGDAQFQKKCIGKMQDVGKEGRTVLFVSHNMSAVRNLCTRAIMLSQGRIAIDDEVSSVVDQYLSFGEGTGESEIEWSEEFAPSCEELSLQGIRILGEEGKVLSVYDATKAIEVEVRFKVMEPIRGMRTALRLFNSEGELGFVSTNHTVVGDKYLKPGEYVTVCNINNNLLNDGLYIVNIQFDIPGEKYLIRGKEFLSFHVEGCEGHGSIFPQKWGGVLAPKLHWSFLSTQTE
jgi:lipopolysaccharide transport system ATP-binding protein